MKKILAIAICAVMLCALAVPVFAGKDDSVFASAVVDLLVDLDGLDEDGGFQMRGFTAAPDGKYVYGGFLQQDRHVTKIDTSTGEHVASYKPEIENDVVSANSNYPKGLTVDCRGYLFVGITHDVPATSYISIACVDPDDIITDEYDTKSMKEVSTLTENLGDQYSHTGINGIAAQKIGDKVLLYVVTCYDKDTIRCYDVTDVTNMHLYDGFGVNGVVDYNELTGSQADPGYVAVDVDGYVYLCYKSDQSSCSKGSHVVKIAENGKDIVSQVEVNEAYGICTAGDYLFVSTYASSDSKIVVLNKADLSKVAELAWADQTYALSGCSYGGNTLYIGDHGDGTSTLPGSVLRCELNITRDAKETEKMEKQHVEETTTEATTTESQNPEDPAGGFVVIDMTDPAVVAKLKGDNNCTITYDEVNGCAKVEVTGDDPYFTIPMKKDQRFDGDKYQIIVLTYKTEVEDTTGEIFFTSKASSALASNHTTYFMEAAEDFTELEIDMRDDDNGTWEGEIRSIRIDPSTDGSDDQVFYFKSVVVREAPEEETEPETEKAPETDKTTEATQTTEAVTDKTPETTKAPTTTNNNNNQGGGANVGLIIGIICGAVVVIAVVVFIILKAVKKKK